MAIRRKFSQAPVFTLEVIIRHGQVYHINAVDEVTQFEIVCAVEKLASAI